MPKASWKGLAMIVFALAVLTILFAPGFSVESLHPLPQEIASRR